MKTKRARAHYYIYGAATIGVILFYFLATPIVTRLDLFCEDLFYAIRGGQTPGDNVVIAAIDEKSIDTIGRWPWERSTIAQLVDTLTEYNVKAFGFDIVFSSPETSAGLKQLLELKKSIPAKHSFQEKIDRAISLSNNDLLLSAALKRSDKAVLGYFFHFEQLGLEHLTEQEMESFLKDISLNSYSGIRNEGDRKMQDIGFRTAYAVETNIREISDNNNFAGYFNFNPEIDGSIRKIPLIVKYRDLTDIETEVDYLFPPLSLTLLRRYYNSPVLIWVDDGGVYQVDVKEGERTLSIPTNELGEMRINYYGPAQTFKHLSVVDILEKKIPTEQLENKLVVVGATATAIEDIRVTPFDRVFPGIEIHATIIENVLNNAMFTDPQIPKTLIDLFAIIVFGLILLFTMARFGALVNGGVVIGLGSVSFFLCYYLFSRYLVIVSPVAPLLELVVVSASLYVYRYLTEERAKRYIQGAFGQYLSPKVINQIIQDPEKLKLGGIRKELTAFFSDVAGFSSISEKMKPEELVDLLNEYLTAMTDIVLRYNGTVDKYEGDAIIAFFGAPLDDPDHAANCCFMALDMQQKLKELCEKWRSEGRPELHVRMGINTGMMVIGNMGSSQRMDYTMMGDAVNLAARLEGVNKKYETAIIISQYTYALCKDRFEVRELDTVRVVGKQEAITIYELLSRKGGLDARMHKVLKHYNAGLNYYKNQEWDKAIQVFGNLFKAVQDDGPVLTYLERCLDYRLAPPDKSWDGVHVLTSK